MMRFPMSFPKLHLTPPPSLLLFCLRRCCITLMLLTGAMSSRTTRTHRDTPSGFTAQRLRAACGPIPRGSTEVEPVTVEPVTWPSAMGQSSRAEEEGPCPVGICRMAGTRLRALTCIILSLAPPTRDLGLRLSAPPTPHPQTHVSHPFSPLGPPSIHQWVQVLADSCGSPPPLPGWSCRVWA